MKKLFVFAFIIATLYFGYSYAKNGSIPFINNVKTLECSSFTTFYADDRTYDYLITFKNDKISEFHRVITAKYKTKWEKNRGYKGLLMSEQANQDLYNAKTSLLVEDYKITLTIDIDLSNLSKEQKKLLVKDENITLEEFKKDLIEKDYTCK